MKILMRLFPYFKGHGWKLFWGFAFMVLQNFGLTAMPRSIQRILDEILGENTSSVVLEEAFWVVGLMALSGLGMYGMRKLIIGVSRDMEYSLRKSLFSKLSRLDFSFFQKQQTGDLISRCTNDLDHVRVLLGPGIMYIPNSLSRLLMFAPVLVALNPTLTAMVLAQMGVLMVLIVIIMPRMKPLHTKLQEQVGAMNSRVWQILNGLTTLKLYRREKSEQQRFEALNEEYIRRHLHVEKYQALLWPFFQTVFALSEVIILGWGGKLVIQGEMSLGELLQFKVMVSVLAFPVLSLGWVMSILQQGISAMERIAVVMEEPERQPASGGSWQRLSLPEPRATEQSNSQLNPFDLSVEIECRNLSYTYPGQENPSLSEVSFSLAKGEVIGITGPVGCGKSTLLHLLTGILHPEPGQLFINGIDVAELNPEDHHRVMSFVPQDAFLFSRSVEDNIGLSGMMDNGGHPDGFKARVEEAAREAALLEDVRDFPKGLEEWIGEKGVTLSGGQRQRTALARALFKPSPWLLLDDALSAVDADTEMKILDHIRSRGEEQGMVIVSHRISAIRHARRILVLNEGKVLDEGTHEDLMSREGLYQHLAELQQMEKELEVVS